MIQLEVGDILFHKRDTIRDGDTLQQIQFRNFGTIDGWYDDLAQLNNLEYPYIVNTSAEKLKNPAHLLTVGDLIKLPSQNDLQSATLDDLSVYATDNMYDVTMGMDLKVELNQGQLFDENSAELVPNSKHTDLDTVKGIETLRQSLFLRLMTRKGTLLMHPNYGSYIPDYIGKPITKDTLADIGVEMQRTITTDDRVEDVSIIASKIEHQQIFVAVRIKPISAQQAFDIFLYRADDGQFLLK